MTTVNNNYYGIKRPKTGLERNYCALRYAISPYLARVYGTTQFPCQTKLRSHLLPSTQLLRSKSRRANCHKFLLGNGLGLLLRSTKMPATQDQLARPSIIICTPFACVLHRPLTTYHLPLISYLLSLISYLLLAYHLIILSSYQLTT